MNTIQDKLNSLQQKLYRITRATWGLSPTVKKDIYNKVINRIIHYGHEIWYRDKVKLNTKLGQLQRSGLLNITKCYKTVSTDALQVLAGVPPIDIQIRHTHKMFQIKHLHKEISTQGLAFHPDAITFLKPIVPPWHKTSFHWSHFNDKLQGTLIYTDGSKMNNRVG
ncbi:retrovirus-related Pol polyprotein from type-1 retrotransposable element R1 4, partial [Caerostris darwini]